MPSNRNEEVRDFLIERIAEGDRGVVGKAAERFGISRQACNRHMRALVDGGVIAAKGNTRARQYALLPILERGFEVPIVPGLAEDLLWDDCGIGSVSVIPKPVLEICHYGFTEITNNAIDHSEGTAIDVHVSVDRARISIMISDDGVGIFKKIKDGLGLADERQSIIELSKGKVTTDPARHTGEGVFFTTRLFDEFSMFSGKLFFSHTEPDDDWLIETAQELPKGTRALMIIRLHAKRTTKEVFDRYTSSGDTYAFSKTHVPVSLIRVGEENLVSRSQAKRLLARFDRFQEVMLDFNGVLSIGQAFADEIFRVFRNANPHIRIIWIRANPQVERVILGAMMASDRPPVVTEQG